MSSVLVSLTPTTPVPGASAARRSARWASPRYYAVLTLLIGSIVVMQALSAQLGLVFRKLPVPLKAPLTQFNLGKLGPRYVPATRQPDPIDKDMLDSLGTTELVNAVLVDESRPPDDPARVAHLFITYYTGKRDQVPHVADECYVAAGHTCTDKRYETTTVPGIGPVPVRVLQFRPRDERSGGDIAVLYFFHTNGKFATTRDAVRLAQMNPLERYAYFAKFEVRFENPAAGRRASADEALAALPALLERVLPVFFADHLQWDQLTAAGRPAAQPGQEVK